MPKQILVASPHLAFGELLRLSLEESGQYRVRLVHTGAEARSSAGRAIFSLLILDADLQDGSFVDLAHDIYNQQPQARLILIPPDNDPQHPMLQGLTADAYLNKPFYLPDLMETVEGLMAEPVAAPVAAPAPAPAVSPVQPQADVETGVQPPQPPVEAPAWLQNKTGIQRLLDETIGGGHVHAALILTGGEVSASSGSLSTAAVQELAGVLARTWERHKNSDQARFVRLAEGGDQLLYATSLAGQVALALACEVSLALTRARSKAAALARQLQELPPAPAETEAVAARSGSEQPDAGEENPESENGGTEIPDLRLLELLADAPSPDPVPEAPASSAQGWAPENAAETTPLPVNLPWEQILAQPPARLPDDPPSPFDAPTVAIRRRSAANDAPTVAIRPKDNGHGTPAASDAPAGDSGAPAEELPPPPPILPASAAPSEIPAGEAAPQPFFKPVQGSLLSVEPTSPTLSHLSYTVLLLPRFPQHLLVGELSEELSLWVPQLCLAFGWRLEGLSIRPETLQFALQVAPSVSPGNVVRILRQRTSQRIFNRFPDLKDLNPSGDFWAPGYLIISGSTPPQPNLLNDFVAQTRRRQGLAAA